VTVTGLLKTTVWLIVVLLMVLFLYTTLTGPPVSRSGPSVGSEADRRCVTDQRSPHTVSYHGKWYDKDCLEEWDD
jgi:hypothetical protein